MFMRIFFVCSYVFFIDNVYRRDALQCVYTTFIIIDLEDVRRTAARLYNDNKQNPHKLFVHEDFVYYLFEIISKDTFLFF